MKKLLPLFAVCVLTSHAFAQSAAEKAQIYYQAGQAAEKSGDPAAAREAYTKALAVNPQHANARYRLGELKLHSGSIAAKGREAKFGSVIVPAFQVDGATVQESIDALSAAVNKASKEEVAPNFIIQDPSGKFSEKKVSIQLKNIPAKAVLDYIMAQAGGKSRFDEHAIVLTPR